MRGRGIGRGGRPGLMGTMARTAVIAGTATAVSGGMQRKSAANAQQAADAQAYQQEQQMAAMQAAAAEAAASQIAAQAPPPPAAAAAPPAADPIAQLKELAALKEQGILTDEEFAAQKARILG